MSDNESRYASLEQHHALETRVAVMENTITLKLDSIKELIKEQRAAPAQSSVDQFSLALQHFASKLPSQSSSPVPYRMISAAVVAVAAVVLYGMINGWH